MYKLLIADDEARIRKGLRNSINWTELNIEIVGEAEDGEIALKLVKELNPHIIMLDICMPFLNGLELIKKLKNINEKSIIIIVTGYDQFEYMHEALKLKVFDYILKPVNKENLKDTILKAVQELSKIERKRNYLNWTSRQVDENLNSLRQVFFNNWFKDKLTHKDIIDELKFLKIKFSEHIGMISIKVVEKFKFELYFKNWDRELLNFAIINIACDLLEKFKPEAVFIDENNNIIIFTNICSGRRWYNLGSELEEKVYSYLGYIIVTEQEKVLSGINEVKDIYNKLVDKISEKTQCKPVVLLTMKYINKNYHVNDLNLQSVADQFNVSSSYLSKLIKQEIGISFSDYITNIRIKKAICFMEDPKMKIYEVAESVGYSNQHYFCKAFKKVIGVSPTEYRGGNV
ncbi:response regulator transcription factor [Clostridium drakei]|uniref:Stage 0 sporulation protein A homolog n=1 Tax=Clostridium drakei TaxID=332101 RepID=A0A2U8DRV4_9CLOT|nr:response regulator [Clostridium drakei]AWI05349.1 DNA-binding response regulator [Clostridium drakei]